MNKQKFLILFLLIFAIAGVVSFLERATTYIGKDAIDAGVVMHLQESYVEYLYETEVKAVTKEQLLENNPVTDAEINAYRTYNGTLEQQINKINEQYDGATGDKLKERNEKIAAVRAKFEDDELARKKVESLKLMAIEGYIRETYQSIEPFNKQKHFNYEIEVQGQPIKQKSGNANPIRELTETFQSYQTTVTVTPASYMANSFDLHFELKVGHPAAVIKVELLDSIHSDKNFGDEIGNFEWRQMAFYMLWLFTGLAIIYLILERKEVQQLFKQLPNVKLPKVTEYIDVNIALFIIGAWLSLAFTNGVPNLLESIVYDAYYGHSLFSIVTSTFELVLLALAVSFTMLVAMKLYNQLRQKTFKKEQFVSSKLIDYMQQVFYNRSIGKQMLMALIVFTCAGFGLAVVMIQPLAILLYLPLFVLIVIPTAIMFLRRFAQLSRVINHTEKLANGQIVEPLKPEGHSLIANHIENINQLQAGVRDSVQAQAKSERMKTELITNVSHDLRTPLTSIITYTDLLKAENLTNEERQKYVAILESKSQRLKTLIEDLFEVSKMASGNMEIQRQQIDIAQLLQQIAAEHEEDFEQASLALRMAIEEQPLFVKADGQKLSRVIDNLLINARKYSLANTRVYVTLQNEADIARLTIKNVTKYELGENVDELTERFKRGDASRNTEGSGLGLAIAQSIVELHGGTMQIELIGDLFQVSLRIPK